MNARFLQDGDAIDYTPASDVAAGDVVVQGQLVGIAKHDIPAGTLGALAVKGVFEVPAIMMPVSIDVGDKVYWDTDNQVSTSTDGSGAYPYMGKAIATNNSDKAQVRLDQ